MVMKGFQYISESAFYRTHINSLSFVINAPSRWLHKQTCVYSLLTDLDSSANRLSPTVRAHFHSPDLLPSLLFLTWYEMPLESGQGTWVNKSWATLLLLKWHISLLWEQSTTVVSWSGRSMNHPLQPRMETEKKQKQVKSSNANWRCKILHIQPLCDAFCEHLGSSVLICTSLLACLTIC